MVSKTFDIVVKETGLAEIEKRLSSVEDKAKKVKASMADMADTKATSAIQETTEAVKKQKTSKKDLTDVERAYNQIVKETTGSLTQIASRHDALNRALKDGVINQGFFNKEIEKSNLQLTAHQQKMQGITTAKAKLSQVEIEMNKILADTAGHTSTLQARQEALEKSVNKGVISWGYYENAMKRLNAEMDNHQSKLNGIEASKGVAVAPKGGGGGGSALAEREARIQQELEAIRARTSGTTETLKIKEEALASAYGQGAISLGFYQLEMERLHLEMTRHQNVINGVVVDETRLIQKKSQLTDADRAYNQIIKETGGVLNGIVARHDALHKALKDGVITQGYFNQEIQKTNQALDAHGLKLQGVTQSTQKLTEVEREMNRILEEISGGFKRASTSQEALENLVTQGRISWEQYEKAMKGVNAELERHKAKTSGATPSSPNPTSMGPERSALVQREEAIQRELNNIRAKTIGVTQSLEIREMALKEALAGGTIVLAHYNLEMNRLSAERKAHQMLLNGEVQEVKRVTEAERVYERIVSETTGALKNIRSAETALTRARAEGLIGMQAYTYEMQQLQMQALAIRQRMGLAERGVGGFSQMTGEARQNLMNLGYQVNDVVVGLASGQRPMTVFIQQGAQIAQVAAQMAASQDGFKASVKGMFSALGQFALGIGRFLIGPIGLSIIAVTTISALLYNEFKAGIESATGKSVTFGNIITGLTKYISDMGKEVTQTGENTKETTGLTSQLGGIGNRVYATLTEYISSAADASKRLAFNTNEVIVGMRKQIALNNALAVSGQTGFEEKTKQGWEEYAKKKGLHPVMENTDLTLFDGWKWNDPKTWKAMGYETTFKRNEDYFIEKDKYEKEAQRVQQSSANLAISKEISSVAIKGLETEKERATAMKDEARLLEINTQLELGRLKTQHGQLDASNTQKAIELARYKTNQELGKISSEDRKKNEESIASGEKQLSLLKLQNQLKDAQNKKSKEGELIVRKQIIALQNPSFPPSLVAELAGAEMMGQGLKESGKAPKKEKLTEGQKAGLKYEDITLALEREFIAYDKLGEAKEAQIKLNQILGKFNPEQLHAIQGRIPALEAEVQRLIHKKKVSEEIDRIYGETKGALEALTVKEEGINEAYKKGILTLTQYNQKLADLKASRAELAVSSGQYTQEDLRTLANQQQVQSYEKTRIELLTKTRNELSRLNGEEQAYNEALKAGAISQEQYQKKMIDLMAQRRNIAYENGGGNFSDALRGGFIGGVANDNGGLKGLENQFQSFYSSVKTGMGDSIGQAIFYGESFADTFGNTARQALSQFTSGLIQLGIQWAAIQVIGDSLGIGGKAGGGLGGLFGGLMGSNANQNGQQGGATVGQQGGGASGASNPMTAPIAEIGNVTQNTLASATGQFNQFFGGISSGFNTTFGNAINQTAQLGLSLEDIGMNALNTIVQGLVQVGLQWLIMETVGAAMQASMIGSTTLAASAISAAWAPAAALASLATLGANAAPAITGIALTTSASMAVASLSEIASVAGFESGGYTGSGGKKKIAGVVHGQEFVVNAEATRRNRPALEAMNANRPYGGGGTGGGASSPRVVVHNYGSSKITAEVTHDEIRIIAREESARTVRQETPRIVAREIDNPNSRASKALARNTKTQRRI